MCECAKNTDRELWREIPGDFYSPRIWVTDKGGIGMDVGRHCIIMPVRQWHSMAKGFVDLIAAKSPNSFPDWLQHATQPAPGTPAMRQRDGALQIEPPDKLTGDSVSATPGEVSGPKAESGQAAPSPREPSPSQGRSEPRRGNPTPTSDKGCPPTGTDRSEAARPIAVST